MRVLGCVGVLLVMIFEFSACSDGGGPGDGNTDGGPDTAGGPDGGTLGPGTEPGGTDTWGGSTDTWGGSSDTWGDTGDPPDGGTDSTDGAPSVIVEPVSGITLDESVGSATFTVVLSRAPISNVSISLINTAEGELSLHTGSILFSAADWNLPHTVTLTAIDDDIADGNQPFVIVTEPSVSSDPVFHDLNGPNVEGTVIDDDVASFSIQGGQGLATSERGESATFEVALTSQPLAAVTMPVSVSDDSEGAVSVSSLLFTAQSWREPQSVVITGLDDADRDGDVAYEVLLGGSVSDDPAYNGATLQVAVVNADDDAPNVIVAPRALTTGEDGRTGQFTVELTMAPAAEVAISVTGEDPSEGTVAPGSLVFTLENWSTPQVVTVTGVDDGVADGDVTYSVSLGNVVSSDPAYAGLVPPAVSVTNLDDDTAGIVVSPTAGLQTSELGATAVFTVVLGTEPSSDVTVSLTSSDTGEGTVAPGSLLFTPENWSTPQVVTITGVNDTDPDGPVAYTIVTAATSSDTAFDGVDVADVSVTNLDDEVTGAAVFVSPTAGLRTAESGTSTAFTVVLGAEPTSTVGLTLTLGDTTEGALDKTTLIFSAASWSTPQTVTVTGIDDGIDDGDVTYAISAAVVSNDASYAALAVPDISVTNTDDDEVGVTVTTGGILHTDERGQEATFTVVLDCQPADTVIIPVSSSDETEGVAGTTGLSFSTSNWDTPQTVTVTGVNDTADDGDTAYTILLEPVLSDDPAYSGLEVSDVAVINFDNDPVIPCANPAIIDDMEDGDYDICENEDRTGSWYTYNESTTGTQTLELYLEAREDSVVEMRTVGSSIGSWGATVGVILNGVTLAARLPYDVSGYTGIRFWIRRGPDSSSPSGVIVNMVQENTANTDQGGTCEEGPEDCSDHYADSVSVSSTWKQYTLPFSGFDQVGWGDYFPMDLENVLGFEFLMEEYSAFDLLIDDFEFY